MSWLSAIPVVGKFFDGLFGVIDQVVEDKDKANELKATLEQVMQNSDLTKFTEQIRAQTSIILAEANSQSWLARNWRPGLMTLFGFIIFNNYVLNPWLAAMFSVDVMLDIPPDMWALLKIGLGGYVVGRSTEKVAEIWKKNG
jgi:hypothetical protein